MSLCSQTANRARSRSKRQVYIVVVAAADDDDDNADGDDDDDDGKNGGGASIRGERVDVVASYSCLCFRSFSIR